MRITVSMESAKFCPNLYRCTHQNCDSAEPTRTVRTYRRKAQLHREFFDSSQQKKRKSCDLDGKHRKNVHFYCFRVRPNPICRRRAEEKCGADNVVNAAKVDSRQRCRNSKLSKGGIAIETKHHMHFEMTPDQYRQLSENAKACGLSKRAYLICLIQGHPPKARQNNEMKALRREIHAIGNNINQIARSVNAGIAAPEDAREAVELLGRVYEKLYDMGRR